MAEYKLTNKAVEDLAKIWEYTVEVWSENQADKYYETLLFGCAEIAKKSWSRKKLRRNFQILIRYENESTHHFLSSYK